MPIEHPSASIHVREHNGQRFYEAKFRFDGRQIKRRIGPVGSPRKGCYDERRATVAAHRIVREHIAQSRKPESGATFREVALAYLRWLEEIRGAKPSTLRDHRSTLAGHRPIMRAIGDLSAEQIDVCDVEQILAGLEAGPRTVNKHRAVMSAVFNYGRKQSTFGLSSNPAAEADRRREPQRGPLVYYTVAEVELLAETMGGKDGEMVRVSAYAGTRQGELLALRPGDITRDALSIEQALSAGLVCSTKSGKPRRVPLPEQAQDALARSEPDGERIYRADPSALRRRLRKAQTAAGLRPLRWHDLRHTYGSLLAKNGVDLVAIKDAMGHASLTTTGRYLHARPAHEQAQEFTRAFAPA